MLIAVLIAVISFFTLKNKSQSLFLVLMLTCYIILDAANLTYLKQYFFLMVALFESMFLIMAIIAKFPFPIIAAFLISIVYNGITCIEYPSEFSLFYDNYIVVMRLLIAWLVLYVIYDGLRKNGLTDNHHSNSNYTDNSGGGFYFRGSI